MTCPTTPTPTRVARSARHRSIQAFTLVELLVVIAIIVLLTAIAVPVLPSLMKSNQFDANVSTLAGIMEQARETAISNNTFVWVAFNEPSTTSPGNGIWVASIKSADGTDPVTQSGGNSGWLTPLTIPNSNPNLQLLSKIQNLPGIKVVDWDQITAPVKNNGLTPPTPPTSPTYLQGSTKTTEGPLGWTVTPAQYTAGYNSTTGIFNQAVEFTPDGEAHVVAWNSNIQFGMVSSTSSATNNVALLNLSRLTGKLTVYRN
ncbi:MAG: prepilin-type N-terminal cleavage/methylation domain-containing protein [Methylacidiphilales bacterium]|nr:prepilin-type N-terminal cleavage/methylation domain-containing protein [Candidatus Methylacidiphilales bacterium]